MSINDNETGSIRSHLTDEEYAQFQSWIQLGVGGLPHTLEGFRRLQDLNKKLRNPLDWSRIASQIGTPSDLQRLSALLVRNGPRPAIAPFAVPHRQMDQHNTPTMRERQQVMFDELVEGNARSVQYRKSYFEKHNEAVFLRDNDHGNRAIINTSHGEIGHIHPSDGSMHFCLSPSDTREVLQKAWGELHGLAGQVYADNDALPDTYVMVYSPRTDEELRVVRQILQAAIDYSATQ